MRKLGIGCAALLSLLMAACGGSSNEAPPYTGFVQPAGTVAVTFTVVDTANKVFTAGNLQWKGSMIYDSATRKITCTDPLKPAGSSCPDNTWGGPWATLFDDGSWTSATTSHEGTDVTRNPAPTAGDNIWGVTIFVKPPATGSDTYEYGLNDGSLTACATPGPACRLLAVNGWIWTGANGTFTVAAGATAAITAPGITFPTFGTRDVRFTIDTTALDGSFAWDTTKISVKGSAWGWNEILLIDDGTLGDAAASDSNYTFQLGQYTGAGKTLPHAGLANAGDKPEFVFVFNGKEYKDASGNCLATGITAETKAGAGAWTSAAITLNPANKNTWITVP